MTTNRRNCDVAKKIAVGMKTRPGSPSQTTSDQRLATELGNHQFATALLLQRHGGIKCDDCALDFFVVGRLSGNSL